MTLHLTFEDGSNPYVHFSLTEEDFNEELERWKKNYELKYLDEYKDIIFYSATQKPQEPKWAPYFKKRRHKTQLKKRYGKQQNRYNIKEHEADAKREYEKEVKDENWWVKKHPQRNEGYEYWNHFYLSARRKYAKKETNNRIRQRSRQDIKRDAEEATALKNSQYQKEFDYNWEIW